MQPRDVAERGLSLSLRRGEGGLIFALSCHVRETTITDMTGTGGYDYEMMSTRHAQDRTGQHSTAQG